MPDTAPAAEIYGGTSAEAWNRLHAAIFSREDARHGLKEDVPDPPLWPDTRYFLNGDAYARLLAALHDLSAPPRSELTNDPLRAAVMQHDLWAAFDWVAGDRNDGLDEHRRQLRGVLAVTITRLALTPEQIGALPDNLARAHQNEDLAANPPADLLQPDGPWVCLSREAAKAPAAEPVARAKGPPRAGDPVAVAHVQAFGGRSAFNIYLNLPDGRTATEAYCRRLNQVPQKQRKGADLPQFPVGTRVALVRRMMLIASDGTICASPLVETVQVRTFRALQHSPFNAQQMQEFQLRRRDLFDGRSGLIAVDGKDTMYDRNLPTEVDGDPIEHGVNPRGIAHLMICGSCHAGTGIRSFNSYTGNFYLWYRTDLWPGDGSAEPAAAAAWKTEQPEWKRLREAMALTTSEDRQ